ncbi:hypothetical protein C7Y66_16445 [Chroococcidiopsis sp. CCALA 051]|uniref:hypothetical protein n=1 Tax=Chroococcidiopsis sp. CCALA 051 TaxID=869949 RepID=UPI000D0DDF9B|nr:hypothetical protein [Chroococcidiopsis sp. CCALA 051]PSM48063.1 hypothetical protein C7Y66_16445 [Chroococcidiopsis sp. CCALA 051]
MNVEQASSLRQAKSLLYKSFRTARVSERDIAFFNSMKYKICRGAQLCAPTNVSHHNENRYSIALTVCPSTY